MMITYTADNRAALDVCERLAAIEDPGERLATITEVQLRRLEALELETVQEMRAAGCPWSEIAGALQVSREAAWQRYHHQAPGPTDRRLR